VKRKEELENRKRKVDQFIDHSNLISNEIDQSGMWISKNIVLFLSTSINNIQYTILIKLTISEESELFIEGDTSVASRPQRKKTKSINNYYLFIIFVLFI
jgi:hypothetical protein